MNIKRTNMKTLKITLILAMIISLQDLQAQDSYYFSKTVKGSFEAITSDVKSALKDQGFGVITEIDMDIKIQEKLKDVVMNPYKILGICNPGFAYETLQIDENIGVFLPCKAIIKDNKDGTVEVVIVNPSALMGMLNNPDLTSIANKVSIKFQTALENL